MIPKHPHGGLAGAVASICALLLSACASGPPPPDWQINAKAALEHALVAYLTGDTRSEAAELERARRDVARTGRVDLLARVELAHCAARVASLAFEACTRFDTLRADAPPAERAYADYLAGRLKSADTGLLPSVHRAAAASTAETAADALRAMDDPLSRLVAAGVLFRSQRARPAVIALAVETASAQGWQRPLLAWLKVQLALAEKAGAGAEAARIKRRIAVVQGEQG
jgi:hypothetical protein